MVLFLFCEHEKLYKWLLAVVAALDDELWSTAENAPIHSRIFLWKGSKTRTKIEKTTIKLLATVLSFLPY